MDDISVVDVENELRQPTGIISVRLTEAIQTVEEACNISSKCKLTFHHTQEESFVH